MTLKVSYSEISLLIDGEWISAKDRTSSPVINPATGEVIGQVPHATTADLDRAIESTQKGFHVWRNTPAYERAKVLRKAAAILRERTEKIAQTLTLEQGKPLFEARYELGSSADYFEWFAEEGRRVYGRIIPSRNLAVQQLVKKEPIGPVAAFAPWNFPAITPSRKIGAALAAGCSIIIKPGEECPATAVEIARALQDAGLPAGVLNVLFGNPAEISEFLIKSPVIRKVSFTGSVPVGRHLSAMAGEALKPITLELGGHAPVIVCADADLEKTAQILAAGKFRGTGQICLSPTRILVQRSVYEVFLEKFVQATRALKVGDGMDSQTQVGPLSNERRIKAIEEMIADAKLRGARIMAGGERISRPGLFWEPTILADVEPQSLVMHEEPFGPIAVVLPFDSIEQAIAEANRLPYGLAAYAFTESARTAVRLGNELEAGMIGINHTQMIVCELPFGGIKDSGQGSEGGAEGIQSYLTTKFISQV
ncbi:aldehyde dehydrogenase family protein [Polynucleobacter sp. UK-Mo-2m-Kol15]|uniref:NAD-dependent succinate-semialdehyde dehydrogenase n=1 Tax=Polynucleobacter sp. UK-Mo-2m-Kol15 TaxID=2576916 RepID=UPI001C0E3BB9|nr:NAD-dependent succinate-semialdehyde dehydrogenase [Polynucleobacter sp. UK-Mo-2m-Kol15]